MKKVYVMLSLLLCSMGCMAAVADYVPAPYKWESQSKNSSESMPCGGHDVGMNVWVENGDVLIYLSRSGYFDENNTLLKSGRLRLRFMNAEGNPVLNANDFVQTLVLDEGCVEIKGGGVTARLWADVEKPVVYLDVASKKAVKSRLSFESWRYDDVAVPKEACQQFSWKWLSKGADITRHDSIVADGHVLTFMHQNLSKTVFDYTVECEGLNSVKSQIPDPIGGLTFGGRMLAPDFSFVGISQGRYASTDYRAWNYECQKLTRSLIAVEFALSHPDAAKRTVALSFTDAKALMRDAVKSKKRSMQWWHSYWQRSFIKSDNAECAKLLRNYELFRYMLGCNAYGEWPTKFNGGLFTFDPEHEMKERAFTPDYRCWGGGTMTAQNQRLVYWPMLKSGDVDMMKSQFDTYLRMLPAAMARTRFYWNHDGACFEEQIENFGLPNPAEYGKHKEGQDISWMKNKWLEYLWDTSLEFCQMILLANRYEAMDVTPYRELIRQCVVFFDEHYRMLARKRGSLDLNSDGKLIIYPGSGCETYKMTYNSSATVAALKAVLAEIDEHHGGLEAWGIDTAMISRIPDIPLTTIDGNTCIAPAVAWERIQNVETPQLYPVFPWRIYGLGRPDIEVARNTYLKDPFAISMHSPQGWKQDNIWAADLGLTDEAVKLLKKKFADGPFRFPAFWERGFDWSPDHNRGGSAMIGLQEMLLQETPDGELLLFPAWPKEWNCEFRLKATGGRTVDAKIQNGEIISTGK